MSLDFNSLGLQSSIEDAVMQFSIMADEMERNRQMAAIVNHQSSKRDAVLVAGAEASVVQKELLEQQLESIKRQNELLLDNYNKMKEMYDDQVQTNQEAKEDLKNSRRFNIWMMVIAVIAMFAAIASPIATILVSK